MNFASDNWAGAAGPIAAALAEVGGTSPAYGGDAATRAAEEAFARVFERDVAVFFVATGTAANSLALSALAKPGGLVLCHSDAHINTDEGGAAEFLADLKLIGLDGVGGKVSTATLSDAIRRYAADPGRHGQPVAFSLSQLTEFGAAYSTDEIAALAPMAKESGLAVHMDGARFGNAVAGLGVSPADVTWKAGVDVMSFGGTKGGCWMAEAVIFFDKTKAEQFPYIRKRAGHLISKSRFIATQFASLPEGQSLVGSGRQAPTRWRSDLTDGIIAAGGRLAWERGGNEVFAILPRASLARAREAGARFYEWSARDLPPEQRPRADEDIVRLVTSFATEASEVDSFLAALG